MVRLYCRYLCTLLSLEINSNYCPEYKQIMLGSVSQFPGKKYVTLKCSFHLKFPILRDGWIVRPRADRCKLINMLPAPPVIERVRIRLFKSS
jgi:hypothetical protein